MSGPQPIAGRERPLTILIAALGGEGGGLLADWLIGAAIAEGVLVQSTSIPGVAQRTGATTYYLEMMARDPKADREPVFSLYPAPGHVDIAVASELIEAGRAIQSGFVSPDRTVLVASTHRVLAMEEKTAMGDGKFEAARVLAAADRLAERPILRDFDRVATTEGLAMNAMLLGAIAASGLLPFDETTLEAAIAERGVAPKANIAAFRRGLDLARGEEAAQEPPAEAPRAPAAAQPLALSEEARGSFPADVLPVIEAGIERLADYQDPAYARLYLQRLAPVLDKEHRARHGADHPITRETARWLALWMGYEDVIRVADLKSRASRYSRVRAESKAKPGEPVMITEFLKPGIDEIASILPRALGERLVTWGEKRGLRGTWHMRMRVRTDTILGFLRLRLMARLKPLRRRSWRFALEQAAIERWLGAVVAAAGDPDLAREIAECGRLMKGYSETRERAFANLDRIFNELIDPLVSGRIAGAGIGAGDVAAARQAALADEAGERLDEVLGAIAGKAANGGKQAPAQAAE